MESWVRWLMWVFLGGFVLFWTGNLAGCQGAPQYAGVPTKADSELNFSRGAFGADGSVRVGTNMEGEMSDFQVTDKGGNVKTRIGNIKFKQDPAMTMREGWTPAMAQFVAQQTAYNEIRKTEWAGMIGLSNSFWTGLTAETTALAPIASAWIGGRTQVKVAEAMQPTLVSQLAGLVVGGQLSADKIDGLDAKIAELVRKEILAKGTPVTQPSAQLSPPQAPEEGGVTAPSPAAFSQPNTARKAKDFRVAQRPVKRRT